MHVTPATFVHNRLLRALARVGLRLTGWRVEGRPPALPKYVIIGAPHTSNWDFLLMVAMALSYEIEFVWMGKHTLFKRPIDRLFRWMGGVPINRTRAHGVVERAVAVFHGRERLVMVIAPEGTRRRGGPWKTGFYYVALGAGVPIVLAYVDRRRRVGGIGPAFTPTGDVAADLRVIREFYAPFIA